MFDLLNIKTRRERRQFVKAMIGGVAVMALAYVWIWAIYLLAPEGYWPW